METDYKTAIKNYPCPLDKLIKNAISSDLVEELNIEVARSRFLPSYVMKQDDHWVQDRTTKIKINGEKYTRKKSLVGTVGQLQMSGTSNAVCIRKSDYLNDDKIKADTTCIEIYDFIEKALK